MARNFFYRFIGIFWVMIGITMGLVSIAYVIVPLVMADIISGGLSSTTPLASWLASQFRPNILILWGALLGIFLILIGLGISNLSPGVRQIAVAFHWLLGVYLLGMTLVIYVVATNNLVVIFEELAILHYIVVGVGVFLALLAFGIGLELNSRTAINIFSGLEPTAPVEKKQRLQAMPKLDEYLGVAPVSQTSAARLVGIESEEEFMIRLNYRTTIGSDQGLEIQLDDGAVSGIHAYIESTDGHFYIYDNVSTNGTFVNEEKVRFSKLNSGDLVQFALSEFKFEVDYANN